MLVPSRVTPQIRNPWTVKPSSRMCEAPFWRVRALTVTEPAGAAKMIGASAVPETAKKISPCPA